MPNRPYYKLALYEGRTLQGAEAAANEYQTPFDTIKTYWPLAGVASSLEYYLDDMLEEGPNIVAVNEDGKRWQFLISPDEQQHATIQPLDS
jgi:hypothetical protein